MSSILRFFVLLIALRLEVTLAIALIPFVCILASKLIPFDVPLFLQIADAYHVEILLTQLRVLSL